MFDVSALLSLKPAALITDPIAAPGTDASQTGSFGRILSTQLEVPAPVPGEPGSPSPDLAASAQPTGNRQPAGKILPDTLPAVPETPVEIGPGEGVELKPLDSLLARHVELAPMRPAARPIRSAEIPVTPPEASDLPADDGTLALAPVETAPQPATLLALVQPAALVRAPSTPKAAADAAPTPSRAPAQPTAPVGAQTDRGATTATAAASLAPVLTAATPPNAPLLPATPAGLPAAALLTIPQPASATASRVGAAAPIATSTIPPVAAQAPDQVVPFAGAPIQTASPTDLSVQPPTIAATARPLVTPLAGATGEQATVPAGPMVPAISPANLFVQPAAIAVSAAPAPAPAQAHDPAVSPAGTPIPPILPADRSARQPEQAASPVGAPIQQVPAPLNASMQPLVLPAAVRAILAPTLIQSQEAKAPVASDAIAPLASASPTVSAEADGTPPIAEHPAGRLAAATKLQTARADARPIAGRSDDVAAAPPAAAAAPATASPAAERGTPTASPAQPATILPDIRQPVVGPLAAAVMPATPSETPQDFAALVDRLIAARESAAPQPVQAAISHAEFGRISLDFRQDGGALTVAMNSADPGFAPAVAAAVAADKFVMPASDVQQPNQSQAAAQAQASSQPQNQGQNQNQSQQPSQSQSPGGNSGQLHQEASGQRGADGSGAQGRNGQERSPRYQSNPSQSGRDNGSPQSRKGTYA